MTTTCPNRCGTYDPTDLHVTVCTAATKDRIRAISRASLAEQPVPAAPAADLHAHFSTRLNAGCAASDLVAVVLDLGWRPMVGGPVDPDQRARAEALREAAKEFDTDFAAIWGGDSAWLTSGTKVASLVAEILCRLADDAERS